MEVSEFHRVQPTKRAAVIDLGSNSWRLVVYSFVPGLMWRRNEELFESLRMAGGLELTHLLGEKAIARGLQTLELFANFSRAHGLAPTDVEVVATSAIRDAENSQELLNPAREATGFDIQVLTPFQEARYGFLAGINSTTLEDGAVLDIGGGSMQLVGVEGRGAKEYRSWQLGAVRVTERLLSSSDPVPAAKLKRVRESILRELQVAEWLPQTGSRLVGIGGAVRNLAVAVQRSMGNGAAGIQGFVITKEELDRLVTVLAARSVRERRDVPGIKSERADVILAAAVVVQVVLEFGDFAGIEVTEAGLREGIFFANHYLKDQQEPIIPDVRKASVLNCMGQYGSDHLHVEHVAELSGQIYEALIKANLIVGNAFERELLWAAAMLHDVGTTIDYDDHHKHSRYLILKSGLPGFNPRELALIAQIARYHRKGMPNLEDLSAVTQTGDIELVRRCALIVRLAEHLDRGHDRSIEKVWLEQNGGDAIELNLSSSGDSSLARWSVKRYRDDESFRRIFGQRLVIAEPGRLSDQ